MLERDGWWEDVDELVGWESNGPFLATLSFLLLASSSPLHTFVVGRLEVHRRRLLHGFIARHVFRLCFPSQSTTAFLLRHTGPSKKAWHSLPWISSHLFAISFYPRAIQNERSAVPWSLRHASAASLRDASAHHTSDRSSAFPGPWPSPKYQQTTHYHASHRTCRYLTSASSTCARKYSPTPSFSTPTPGTSKSS